MMQCECCGAEFEVKQKTQRFCSASCRRKGERVRAKDRGYKRSPDKPRYAFVCKHCGKEYQTAYADRNTYCSRECSFNDKERRCACGASLRESWSKQCDVCLKIHVCNSICIVCGIDFYSRQAGCRYCSDECVKEGERRRAHDVSKQEFYARVTPKKCKECSCVFIPEYGTKRRVYCSAKCLKKAMGRLKPRNHQQRAKKYGVEYRYFSDMTILKRDGWQCYICGCSTPKELRGTYENNAPEIDHIIPLSKGGSHTKDNVRCCCRACNLAKTNMTLEETRRLKMFKWRQQRLRLW